MKIISDIKYGSFDDNVLDIYLPDKIGFETVVWFHGGGLESGSREVPDLAQSIVENGYAFISADYRMYPSAKYPEFLIDAANAVSFVQKNIRDYGGNNKLFISGQSAGAYITMMLCMNDEYLKSSGVDPMSISGFIAESSQQTTHFNVLREYGMDPRLERIDKASPMFYLNSDITLTHLLMIYYSDDIQCRPEQNRLIYKSFKHIVPDADVRIKELNGSHCQGSAARDENGNYPYVTELIKFIGQISY